MLSQIPSFCHSQLRSNSPVYKSCSCLNREKDIHRRIFRRNLLIKVLIYPTLLLRSHQVTFPQDCHTMVPLCNSPSVLHVQQDVTQPPPLKKKVPKASNAIHIVSPATDCGMLQFPPLPFEKRSVVSAPRRYKLRPRPSPAVGVYGRNIHKVCVVTHDRKDLIDRPSLMTSAAAIYMPSLDHVGAKLLNPHIIESDGTEHEGARLQRPTPHRPSHFDYDGDSPAFRNPIDTWKPDVSAFASFQSGFASLPSTCNTPMLPSFK